MWVGRVGLQNGLNRFVFVRTTLSLNHLKRYLSQYSLLTLYFRTQNKHCWMKWIFTCKQLKQNATFWEIQLLCHVNKQLLTQCFILHIFDIPLSSINGIFPGFCTLQATGSTLRRDCLTETIAVTLFHFMLGEGTKKALSVFLLGVYPTSSLLQIGAMTRIQRSATTDHWGPICEATSCYPKTDDVMKLWIRKKYIIRICNENVGALWLSESDLSLQGCVLNVMSTVRKIWTVIVLLQVQWVPHKHQLGILQG